MRRIALLLLFCTGCGSGLEPCDPATSRLVGLSFWATVTVDDRSAVLGAPACTRLHTAFQNALFVTTEASIAYFDSLASVRVTNDYAIRGDTTDIGVFITTLGAPQVSDTSFLRSLGGVGYPLAGLGVIASEVPLGRLQDLTRHPRFVAFDVDVAVGYLAIQPKRASMGWSLTSAWTLTGRGR